MNWLRALIVSVASGAIRQFTATSADGEQTSTGGLLQHYGFASAPLKDSEALILTKGNVAFAIATEDRRYRIALQDGEVSLYTDEGDKVHLKRGRVVEVVAGAKVSMVTPVLEVQGKITATGNIEAGADIKDAVGTLAAVRTAYDTHVHTVPAGGTTGPAVPQA